MFCVFLAIVGSVLFMIMLILPYFANVKLTDETKIYKTQLQKTEKYSNLDYFHDTQLAYNFHLKKLNSKLMLLSDNS